VIKQDVFRVAYFLQHGMLCGGIHKEETVLAVDSDDAVKKVQYATTKGDPHGRFVLVSVTQEGAQG